MNGAHRAGPGAFMTGSKPKRLKKKADPVKKRAYNQIYYAKKRALMEAGKKLLEAPPPEVKMNEPPPTRIGRRGGSVPGPKKGWTEEARAKLSESMKKAHAAKPDWKRKATLRRLGYLPLEDKPDAFTRGEGLDRDVQLDSPPLRKDGKAYVRGPYNKQRLKELQPLIEAAKAVQRPARRDRMMGMLIDNIREELKEHVRRGGDITPFHTNVLALTDYLRKMDHDRDDGI